jgi:hypothetical protein
MSPGHQRALDKYTFPENKLNGRGKRGKSRVKRMNDSLREKRSTLLRSHCVLRRIERKQGFKEINGRLERYRVWSI